MNNLIAYLNEIKAKHGIKSDTQLGLKLGISQAAIQKIMSGGGVSDEVCEKISAISGDKPEFVIALAHASKAKEGTKKHWEKILKAVMAASFVLLFFIVPSLAAANTSPDAVYYVQSSK